MKRIDQNLIFRLGSNLRTLNAVRSEKDAFDVFMALNGAILILEAVLGDESVDLRYSRPAAEALIETIDRVTSRIFKEKDKDGKTRLKFPKRSDIPDHMLNFDIGIRTFETNLAAEFREAPTYYVPKRGAYDTVDLVDHAERILEPDLHTEMGSKAVTEFQAAGRCFAFGLPTATGFHVCRAVEAVLESYYKLFSGKTKTLHGWQDYIDALQKIADDPGAKAKPQKRTLHDLTHLKDSSRNPIMHPRVILDDMDADILLSGGKNVMIEMALEIRENKAKLATKPKAVATSAAAP